MRYYIVFGDGVYLHSCQTHHYHKEGGEWLGSFEDFLTTEDKEDAVSFISEDDAKFWLEALVDRIDYCHSIDDFKIVEELTEER